MCYSVETRPLVKSNEAPVSIAEKVVEKTTAATSPWLESKAKNAFLSNIFRAIRAIEKAEGIKLVEDGQFEVDKLHNDARILQKKFVEVEGINFAYGEYLAKDRKAAKTLTSSLVLFMVHAAVRADLGRLAFNYNWLNTGSHKVNSDTWAAIERLNKLGKNVKNDETVDGRTILNVSSVGGTVVATVWGRTSNTGKPQEGVGVGIAKSVAEPVSPAKSVNLGVSAPSELKKLVNDGIVAKKTVAPAAQSVFAEKAKPFGTVDAPKKVEAVKAVAPKVEERAAPVRRNGSGCG